MDKNDKIQNSIIDKYYNESFDIPVYESRPDEEFERKLTAASEKLEILNHDIEAAGMTFFDIIEKAEAVNNKAKAKKENALFLGIASCLLIMIGIMAASFGQKFIISFYGFAFALMPVMLIAFSWTALTGGKKG
ncbi:MAG: hypothetical protein ACOZCL_16710 [Bacillota bacterium]